MAQTVAQKVKLSFKLLKPRKDWSFSDTERKDTNSFTHSYHRYPAKFIPQIVRKLMNQYANKGNELICDPFGGCGTTLVEAKMLGRKSVGFDINPVAKLITEVKTTPLNPAILKKYRESFGIELKKNKKIIIDKKRHERISYWFDSNTIKKLDKIYWTIKKINNPKIRKFFLCAFSHNLKNSSRWLMKSIKPTIDKNKKSHDPINGFLNHVDSMIKKNELFYNELSASGNLNVVSTMYRKDSTKKLPLKSSSVDLIITSPPYVTSYEYADLHQLSLLWFGDDPGHFKKWDKIANNFNEFRSQFIGTSYKDQKNGILNSLIANDIVKDLNKKDKALSRDVANYFFDMKKVFLEMYRILNKNGKVCMVIGNTTLRDINILNAEVAVEQMKKIGFKKVDYIKRKVSNKMITPWRDNRTGKFTSTDNPNKKRAYEFEYIIVMKK